MKKNSRIVESVLESKRKPRVDTTCCSPQCWVPRSRWFPGRDRKSAWVEIYRKSTGPEHVLGHSPVTRSGVISCATRGTRKIRLEIQAPCLRSLVTILYLVYHTSPPVFSSWWPLAYPQPRTSVPRPLGMIRFIVASSFRIFFSNFPSFLPYLFNLLLLLVLLLLLNFIAALMERKGLERREERGRM